MDGTCKLIALSRQGQGQGSQLKYIVNHKKKKTWMSSLGSKAVGSALHGGQFGWFLTVGMGSKPNRNRL
jgi:hypothetical protein